MKRFFFMSIIFLFPWHVHAADSVEVGLYKEHQTIIANGINFEGYHRRGGNEVLASKFTAMLNALNSQLLRVGTPLEEWEPSNDDNDPENFQWDGFRESSGVSNSFQRLQRLANDGYDLWLAIWDIADWNVKNPGNDSQRRIKDIDEFVESITAYVLRARDKYGAEPMYVSVNEPSIAAENGWGGYQIALTPEEQAEIILKAGQRFQELGLSTKWLIALHKVYPSELEQAQQIYEMPGVVEHIGGFDFHGYWWQDGHDDELAAWAAWTSSTGLPNFAGECDYDNQFWQRDSADKARWTHALETAKLLYKMYDVARAEGSLLWYGDAPTSNRPYRYANKHFYDFMNPGSIILQSNSSSSAIFSTAFKHKTDDKFAQILLNTSNSSRQVTLTGLPNKTLAWIESKDGSYYQTIETNLQPVDGVLTITLAAGSINTIHGKGGGTPTAKFSVDPQIGLPPLQVTFDASESFDPQGTAISEYNWDFGDGQTERTPNPVTTHTFSQSGTFSVTLEIVNAEGEKAFAGETVYASGKADIKSTSDAPMHPSFDGPSESIWAHAPINFISHYVGGEISDYTNYSAQFRLLYTENNIYIRVDVVDDIIAPIDEGERLVLCLDFGNDKTAEPDDNDLVIRTPLDVQYLRSGDVAVEARSEIRADGYTWEFRIYAARAGFPPLADKLIGLEIFATDFDSELDEWGRLSWNGSGDEINLNPGEWGLGQFILDKDNPPNQPPTINITAPSAQSIFNADETIRFAAEADDIDGEVSRVYFYVRTIKFPLLDENGSDGWSVDWRPEETGAFSVKALALDDDYEGTDSELARFFVYENGQPQVLLLVGDTEDLGNDAILQKLLQERNGLDVKIRSGNSATLSDADGVSLIFISESIGSRESEAMFKEAKIPIICCESYIYDDLGLTGGQARSDYGRERTTFIRLHNHSHPLAANMLSDSVAVIESLTSLTFGVPNENADVIATVGDTDMPGIFAYERGDQMVDCVAPAARIGLFAGNAAMGELTAAGSALVNAAVQWALKQPTSVKDEKNENAQPVEFVLKQIGRASCRERVCVGV